MRTFNPKETPRCPRGVYEGNPRKERSYDMCEKNSKMSKTDFQFYNPYYCKTDKMTPAMMAIIAKSEPFHGVIDFVNLYNE
jgi:hypothetical protein